MPLDPRRRPELALLLLACAVLGAAWSLVVPTFEAPDEPAHWSYVTYLARERELPAHADRVPGKPWPGSYESHQPPLFYAAAAALLRFGPGSEERVVLARNPAFRTGPDEANVFEHAPEMPAPQDARPGILSVRLLSAACGLATTLLTYLVANAVFGGRRAPALAAAALVGFSPQFLFIAGSVNNDAMAACLGTAALLPMLRLLSRRPARWWWAAAAGGLVGAAALVKLSALALLPLAGILVLWRALRVDRRPSHLVAFAAAVAGTVGWYVVLNAARRGDPFLTHLAETNTPKLIRRKSLTADYWPDTFAPRLFESFWGYFGWFSVALPAAVYLAFQVAAATGALGLLADVRPWRGRRWVPAGHGRCLLLLAAVVAVNLAAVVQYNLTYSQPQGRFLFPSIAAIAVLLVAGWSALLDRLRSILPPSRLTTALPGALAAAVVLGMGGLNLYALAVVHDAYWVTP
ncbi:MAG: hypothetical protein AVDCRST_MAG49-987 [uncultured Thermomicrobiales bacterium]|uniref:Uncharacterized protein n=1 Tax=uncultured Thermomicrobiales bacterium TaxID=1645740 RepID=A0A6J4U7A2_9BACT|nr:MAG: hypothetical protein AVDCRST_MAG49-987 [uncultured Thermomicrobiales bacterium]